MNLRFGNLTVAEFAERVGTEFTAEELALLESYRTSTASFAEPDKFHIFDDPAISISIGAIALAATQQIWVDADRDNPFNQKINFYPLRRVSA
jgi:hypothetical protein